MKGRRGTGIKKKEGRKPDKGVKSFSRSTGKELPGQPGKTVKGKKAPSVNQGPGRDPVPTPVRDSGMEEWWDKEKKGEHDQWQKPFSKFTGTINRKGGLSPDGRIQKNQGARRGA